MWKQVASTSLRFGRSSRGILRPESSLVVGHELHTTCVDLNSRGRYNMIINFVPQQEAWIVERMGKFLKVLDPGLNLLVPVIDEIKYVQGLKELAIDVPHQSAITVDNVPLNMDGVLYVKVFDPYMASYGVEDPEYAMKQMAMTTMRSEVGKISLDSLFREREELNSHIVAAINKAADPWGITCLRYEIRDIQLPPTIDDAIKMQAEAERRKRASILESEADREAKINRAMGEKQAAILASEAVQQQLINKAKGEAGAIIATAEAKAKAVKLVSEALSVKDGHNAAALSVAESYVQAFSQLAKQTNTVLLPANPADPSAMVAQALAVYKNLERKSDSEKIVLDSETKSKH